MYANESATGPQTLDPDVFFTANLSIVARFYSENDNRLW